MVVIDLSSYNIVSQNRDLLEYLITSYVDIVFANEEEALAFTGLIPEEAVAALGKLCDISVVKTGKTGSLVHRENHLTRIDPIEAGAIDTTGAGDSYAAGFLYGLTLGLPFQSAERSPPWSPPEPWNSWEPRFPIRNGPHCWPESKPLRKSKTQRKVRRSEG